jgi:hypothetical protein
MRRILPFTLAALLAAPAAAQTAPSPSALLAQEVAVWQAIADRHFDAFAAYLARDYVGVYPDGFKDAAQEVASVRGVTLARFQISDFVIRSVDASDVVVTYRIDVSGSAEGHDFAGRYNISSYWHRAGRQWLAELHTQAQIGP